MGKDHVHDPHAAGASGAVGECSRPVRLERLQADGARPYEIGLLLAGGVVPQLLLARPIGRLADTHDSRRLLVGGGLAEVVAAIPLVFLHSVVPIVGLVAVLVRGTLHGGAVWYGVAEASWMAGMVAGALGAVRVGGEPGRVRATVAGAALACAAVAGFAVAPTVAILVPLSVLGGIGNGCAGACLSTLLTTRIPDSARGRASAAAGAVFGGAQGASLLLGGAVAVVLSPRAIYAVAGLLGLTAAGLLALTSLVRSAEAGDSPQPPVSVRESRRVIAKSP